MAFKPLNNSKPTTVKGAITTDRTSRVAGIINSGQRPIAVKVKGSDCSSCGGQMKIVEAPFWLQMNSATFPNDEAVELKFSLSNNKPLADELEAFLYAYWLYLNGRAKKEPDKEIRETLHHYADSISDVSGLLFSTNKQKTTKTMPIGNV